MSFAVAIGSSTPAVAGLSSGWATKPSSYMHM
jgi:hypothetical protein